MNKKVFTFCIAVALVATLAFGGFFGYQLFFGPPEKTMAATVKRIEDVTSFHFKYESTMKYDGSGLSKEEKEYIIGLNSLNYKITGEGDVLVKEKKARFKGSSEIENESFDISMIIDGKSRYTKQPSDSNWVKMNFKYICNIIVESNL